MARTQRPDRSPSSRLLRVVRLTARPSATLFAASTLAGLSGGPPSRAARPLYLGFLLVHASHFGAVARYAIATEGRALFPGGRSLTSVGGWPVLLSIDSLFAGLAFAGWSATVPGAPGPARVVGRTAVGIIGALFAGTYAGLTLQRRRA